VHFPVFQLLTVLRHLQDAIQSAFRNRQKDDDDFEGAEEGDCRTVERGSWNVKFVLEKVMTTCADGSIGII